MTTGICSLPDAPRCKKPFPGVTSQFEPTGRTAKRRICPVMSGSKGMILCQEANCAAAYPCAGTGESTWACAVIDGPGPRNRRGSHG